MAVLLGGVLSGFSPAPRPARGLSQALLVTQVRVSADQASVADTGRLDVRTIVNDEATGDLLETGLLAGQVSVTIENGASLMATVTLTECERVARRIRCRDDSGSIRAQFRPQAPLINAFRVVARRLSAAQTGAALPPSPMRVTIHQQGAADRVDAISDCWLAPRRRLVCHDRGQPNKDIDQDGYVRVLFVGDSNTVELPPLNGWASQFIGLKQAAGQNYWISTVAAQWGSTAYPCCLYAHATSLLQDGLALLPNPDVIVISHGTNDVQRVLNGDYGEDDIANALAQAKAYAEGQVPGVFVYISLVPPFPYASDDGTVLDNAAELNGEVEIINDVIIVTVPPTNTLDLHSMMDTGPDGDYRDRYHMNDAGMLKRAQALASAP